MRFSLLLASLLMLGCEKEREPEVLTLERSWSEQLRAGRSGASDRIELFETVVDDAVVANLDAEDDWVETLILDQGIVTDLGTAAIAQLPSLIHLRLRQSPVTDEGLAAISRCDSIRILNLPQCAATADGIHQLSSLPVLQNLRLGGGHLGPETAAAVASIPSLKQIHLIGVPIDDRGLKEIAGLPKLESLYVDDGNVTLSGWEWFFENHPDVHVHVDQRHLDRDEDHP